MIDDLIRKNRSCRRFYQNRSVDLNTLIELVNLARLSPSAANLQPLCYILSTTPEKNAAIFPSLAWAAYLKDWPGPVEGERPAAYIIMLGDTTKAQNIDCDHGIACQSILLGARARGLAGCIIGAINREQLRQMLAIPEHYKILLVIALGKPREDVMIEPVGADGSIRYWRDPKGIHHVPKRELDDIIVGRF